MGCRQLCRIECFARGRQVTAGFGIIDCRQSRPAKSRRILHDFVAFTVALVILICRRVQWFETRVRPLISTIGPLHTAGCGTLTVCC